MSAIDSPPQPASCVIEAQIIREPARLPTPEAMAEAAPTEGARYYAVVGAVVADRAATLARLEAIDAAISRGDS